MRSLGQQGYLLKRRLPYETVGDPYQSLMSKRTMDNLNAYRDSTIDLGNRQNDLSEKQFNDQQDANDDAKELSEWGLGLSSADLLTRIPWKSAIGGLKGLGGYGAASGAGSAMTGIGSTFASGAGSSALAAEIGGMSGGMTTAGGVGAGSLGTSAGAGAGGGAAATGGGAGSLAGLTGAGAVALPFAVLAAAYGILNAAGEMEHSDEPVSAYRLAISQGIIPDPTSDQAVQYRKYLENMFMAPNPNQDLSQEGGGFGGGGEMQSGILMPGAKEMIDDFMANPYKYLDTGADLVDPFVNVSTPIRQNYMNSQVGNSLWMPQAGLSQEGGGVTGAGTLTGYSNTNFGGNWWDNPSP